MTGRLAIAAIAVAALGATAFGADANPTPAPAPQVVPLVKLRTAVAHRDRALEQVRALRREVRTLRASLHDRDAYRAEGNRYRAEFLCIAGHESGRRWDIATGNGYYGGLQMDRSFQKTYGPELYFRKGTANHWTADEQIAVASRAVPSRGFTPWPNTGRMCGLIR